MGNVEKYDDLIIGSGIAGKFTAWTRDSRRRMAIVDGACAVRLPTSCLPSKNLIWSRQGISWPAGMEFGLKTDSLIVDLAAFQRRNRADGQELRRVHPIHRASGADGSRAIARFGGAPRTGGNPTFAKEAQEESRETAFSSPSVRAPNPRSARPGRGHALTQSMR